MIYSQFLLKVKTIVKCFLSMLRNVDISLGVYEKEMVKVTTSACCGKITNVLMEDMVCNACVKLRGSLYFG